MREASSRPPRGEWRSLGGRFPHVNGRAGPGESRFRASLARSWAPRIREQLAWRARGPGIYTMNPDGTDLTQILLANEPDPDLSWRPRCNIRGTRGGDTLSGNYRAGAHLRLRRQRHRLRLPANDAVFAGEGNDRVYGGRGRDVLAGGAGSDRAGRRPGKGFPERARRNSGKRRAPRWRRRRRLQSGSRRHHDRLLESSKSCTSEWGV